MARSFAFLAALLAGLVVPVACAHREDTGEVVGSSHTAIDAPPERADAGPGANDPQLPPGWREHFVQIGTLGASRGHGPGNWPTTVFADETAAKALRERDEAATGATLVSVHPSKAGELLFVMQKGADGWHYRVRDATSVTRDPPACDACHGQAPHDRLFVLFADAGR